MDFNLSLSDAAKLTHLPISEVRVLARSGYLPSQQRGNRLYFRNADLKHFKASARNRAKAARHD